MALYAEFFWGNQMALFFFFHLNAMLLQYHTCMKEGGNPEGEVNPIHVPLSGKIHRDSIKLVDLSLSYLSQQITVSHCLQSLRDNNVDTLDLIS